MTSRRQFRVLEIKYYIWEKVKFIVLNYMHDAPMTMLCASLAAGDAKGMVGAARDARRGGADIVEVRLDRLRRITAPMIARLARSIDFIPAVATLRPEWEGGAFEGSEDERVRLLGAAAGSGFDYMDLEIGMDAGFRSSLLGICKDGGVRTIVSHHDHLGTPGVREIVQIIERCTALGDIGKVAFLCSSAEDAAKVVEAAGKARRKGLAFVAIGMGEKGMLTRLLAPIMGSAIAYACLDGRHRTAGGQPQIGELLKMWGGPARRRGLSHRTALYGIIGHPLGHSLSPLMHNASFKRLGMDAIYMPFDVKEEDIMGTLLALRAAGLRGANVTIPHKQTIMALLDEIDGAASEIGAVNTIVNRGGRLRGSNTDIGGFVGALKGAGVRLRGARVLVIGAGGAARAAVRGLLGEGASVTVANRTVPRALELKESLGAARIDVAGLEAIPEILRHADILVNCTPAGMRGFSAKNPVPARLLRRGLVVMDMVYNPVRTPLLAAAEKAGAITISGLEMFIRQGMGSFRTWTKKTLPIAEVRKVLAGSGMLGTT